MVLRRLTLRSEPLPATKPAHSATSYCCLRGDVRAGPEMWFRSTMNTVCNFGLSSRSSLIASFRSAAAGDENRAPWVLAPGEALQVNNKHWCSVGLELLIARGASHEPHKHSFRDASTPHPPLPGHLNHIFGMKRGTAAPNFTGHTNDMRSAALKITVCQNATVSEALIFHH